MEKHTFLTRSTLALLTILLTISACKKENVAEISYTDQISSRTIRYSVLVVPADNAGLKSFTTDTAYVSLFMNNKISTVAADKNGLATFNNLAAGNVAVTIRYKNHCTANLIVDLASKADNLTDNNNLRNASTMVTLFPYTGTGTATISGKIFADLDLTTSGLENGPSNTKVSSIIESNQFQNYVTHSGDGQVLAISYENVINQTSTSSAGDYTFQVPATGSGLKIVLKPDDFVYQQQTSTGIFQRKIYKPRADTLLTFSGFNYYVDLTFE
jgi:hypothetical protein